MAQFISPIVLSQSITLASNGSARQTDPTQLLNPNQSAMLIDQFRFVQTMGTTSGNYMRQVYVSIQIGSIHLTNGMVPIATLCPSYDGTIAGTASAGGSINIASGSNPLVWHLPKPMYVPANVVTYVNFLRVINSADLLSASISMRAVVAGRSLPSDHPKPAEIYAPWASASVVDTNQTTTLAGRQIFNTPNNALGNPNDSDMMVTRLTGYRDVLNAGSSSGDTEGPDTTTVKMSISSGKLLVREPTPFYHLFPLSRRYFDMRGILRGKDKVKGGGEFVRAQVSYQAQGATVSNMNLTMLGLIGYRTVPTPQGANG